MFWNRRRKKEEHKEPQQESRRELKSTSFDVSCRKIATLGYRGAFGYYRSLVKYADEQRIAVDKMKLIAFAAVLYNYLLNDVIAKEMKNTGKGNLVSEFYMDMTVVQMHKVVAEDVASRADMKLNEDTLVNIATTFSVMMSLTADLSGACHSLLTETFHIVLKKDLEMIVGITNGCIEAIQKYYRKVIEGMRVERVGEDIVLDFNENANP